VSHRLTPPRGARAQVRGLVRADGSTEVKSLRMCSRTDASSRSHSLMRHAGLLTGDLVYPIALCSQDCFRTQSSLHKRLLPRLLFEPLARNFGIDLPVHFNDGRGKEKHDESRNGSATNHHLLVERHEHLEAKQIISGSERNEQAGRPRTKCIRSPDDCSPEGWFGDGSIRCGYCERPESHFSEPSLRGTARCVCRDPHARRSIRARA
jgi:hypothetical protein